MSERERFEYLKCKFLRITESHMKAMESLTFENLTKEEAGFALAEKRCLAMEVSIEMATFINQQRHALIGGNIKNKENFQN